MKLFITQYLYNRGIAVGKFLKTYDNEYAVKTDKMKFTIQEFIDGEILRLNTAPDWFLNESAQMLGKIQKTLLGYKKLDTIFDEDFISLNAINSCKQHILDTLEQAELTDDYYLIGELKERLKHIDRVSGFKFDISKMAYGNSHGDYYINQIIVRDKGLAVIDWTDACRLPLCFEPIMSFSYASPDCKNGNIPIDGLKRYLSNYTKYMPLSKYDLEIMPYFYYYQLAICNFIAPYDDLSDDYLKITKHCNSIMNWLYGNVEDLSKQLLT